MFLHQGSFKLRIDDHLVIFTRISHEAWKKVGNGVKVAIRYNTERSIQ